MARSTPSIQVIFFLAASILLSGIIREVNATISCGLVASSLAKCIPYARGLAPLTQPCCDGMNSLNSAATSTPDRQTACNCLKNLANRIPDYKPSLAANLPGKCGVSIPYPISTSTDCTKVN